MATVTSLSDLTEVVGSASFGSVTHAAYRDPGTGAIKDLGTLGGTYSEAPSINSGAAAAAVVGRSYTGKSGLNPVEHAFRWKVGGSLVDLNSLVPKGTPWVLFRAYKVTTGGLIVGQAINGSSKHAFLLKP